MSGPTHAVRHCVAVILGRGGNDDRDWKFCNHIDRGHFGHADGDRDLPWGHAYGHSIVQLYHSPLGNIGHAWIGHTRERHRNIQRVSATGSR